MTPPAKSKFLSVAKLIMLVFGLMAASGCVTPAKAPTRIPIPQAREAAREAARAAAREAAARKPERARAQDPPRPTPEPADSKPGPLEKVVVSPTVGTIPEFPWPPPKASAHLVLDAALLHLNNTLAPTLSVVSSRLERALKQTGYEYSYYSVVNGFALVARLERIRADGTPLPGDYRFLASGSKEPFSLSDYIRQLFFAPVGYYRMIVFVVTDQPIITSSAGFDAPNAEKILNEGAHSLPTDIKRAPASAEHSVTALIYEFQKVATDVQPSSLTPSRLSAKTHLDRSMIAPALSAQR